MVTTGIQSDFILMPGALTLVEAWEMLRGKSEASHVVLEANDAYHLVPFIDLELELLKELPLRGDERILDLVAKRELSRPMLVNSSRLDRPVVFLEHGTVVGYHPGKGSNGTFHTGDGEDDPNSGREARSFSAFPHLSAPSQVDAAEPFEITVGFRKDPDARLSDIMEIRIPRPIAGAKCQVVLVPEGVQLERHSFTLPLKVGIAYVVKARLEPGAARARVKAQYLYKGNLVGSATLEIGAGTMLRPVLKANPCRIVTSHEAEPDLTATAMYSLDGRLRWTLFSKALGYRTDDPIETRLEQPSAREFAYTLMRDVPTAQDQPFWPEVLESIGGRVASVMPEEFFWAIEELHKQLERLPTVLLLTEESYVPWELAWVSKKLDDQAPHHLGCQVNLGRWVEESAVALPPSTDCKVQRFYAVGHDGLPASLEEREYLASTYKAIPLSATMEGLTPLFGPTLERNRCLHLGVHGEVNPMESEEMLILADDSEVPAVAFGRMHVCGEQAVCSFMFLNTCQVGTAGRSLGLVAGFPGVMMRAGTEGFVAPLWNVEDEEAKAVAIELYERTIDQGMCMAEALREIRKKESDSSATRLAYVYYGHPNMRLELI